MAGMQAGGSWRQAFQRQPARAVLLDMRPPMDSYTCLNVQEALSSIMGLMIHLDGAFRLPYFGLMVLGNYPECIFPLQPVRGNYPRVHTALNELRSIARKIFVGANSRGCVLDGLQEALGQFHRVVQSLKPSAGGAFQPNQIEITLVTCQTRAHIRKMVEDTAVQLDTTHLRKITAICVADPDQVMRDCAEEGEGVEGKEGMSLSQISDLGLSILDLTSIDNDILSVCNAFKHWLQDCTTDSEHLHLCLPNSFGIDPVILKCDLQETLIDPCSIPAVRHHFVLHSGSGPNPPTGGRVTNNMSILSYPVHKLRAVSLIKSEGVCESVLFGMPHLLKPTACWRLDWQELESNQHNFSALCSMLREKGHFLLVAVDIPHTPLHPHYLILPSPAPSSTLLIKSIAVGELLMPTEPQCFDEQPTYQAVQRVQHCLAQLRVEDSYNPLRVQSSLHETLSMISNKRWPSSRAKQDSGGPPSRGFNTRSLGPKRQYSGLGPRGK